MVFKLWQWFIIPLFNLPSLSFINCVSLLLFTALIFNDYKKTNKEEHNLLFRTLQITIFNIILSSLILLIGWFLTLIN